MTYNLVGKRFGELTVLKMTELKNKSNKRLWLCICDCGKEYLGVTNQLLDGKTLTCGKCSYHTEHRDAYLSWMSAKSRVCQSSNKDYTNYGGRGIKMDTKWMISFKYFLIDMGDPPLDPTTGERLSLDRIDNNGNYSKENCRWATRSQQQLNKRTSTNKKDMNGGY